MVADGDDTGGVDSVVADPVVRRDLVAGGEGFGTSVKGLQGCSPVRWPAELDKCPQEGRRRFVDRRCGFRVAKRAVDTPDDEFAATHLLVAAIIWGTGSGARNAGFRLEGLHQDLEAPIKLTRALDRVRTSGAKSAFDALHYLLLDWQPRRESKHRRGGKKIFVEQIQNC